MNLKVISFGALLFIASIAVNKCSMPIKNLTVLNNEIVYSIDSNQNYSIRDLTDQVAICYYSKDVLNVSSLGPILNWDIVNKISMFLEGQKDASKVGVTVKPWVNTLTIPECLASLEEEKNRQDINHIYLVEKDNFSWKESLIRPLERKE
ncbi:hypothetical protein H6G33_09520 [Calothrix sp. FACHB-1219]|uniref:hypothetical protein n=1 Tax=unclassified Calothrix TaxID=2619626 RepID=UPI0016840BC8|nr:MULTISPECIES: hypothetical protein [unclassified Calothrix]MBD2201585.1 hypothetical protein [Calothrix sp. FACHB-168]MBD2217271.1 hypothetical protein [Calothrix sp. FACHB-1219]